jgi:hypothetical protein
MKLTNEKPMEIYGCEYNESFVSVNEIRGMWMQWEVFERESNVNLMENIRMRNMNLEND